jgi:hypothetical protein
VGDEDVHLVLNLHGHECSCDAVHQAGIQCCDGCLFGKHQGQILGGGDDLVGNLYGVVLQILVGEICPYEDVGWDEIHDSDDYEVENLDYVYEDERSVFRGEFGVKGSYAED